jgi:hypothetical protein
MRPRVQALARRAHVNQLHHKFSGSYARARRTEFKDRYIIQKQCGRRTGSNKRFEHIAHLVFIVPFGNGADPAMPDRAGLAFFTGIPMPKELQF